MSEVAVAEPGEMANGVRQDGRPKQLEVTPGNIFNLGLPFVLQNQSLFNFWDVKSGEHFVQFEGKYYGWDNSTVQISEMGPGQGPPMHQHPVEEIFVLVEGECAFGIGDEVFHVKAPALVRVPPNTPHNITTLGPRNLLVDFFPSNAPGGMVVPLPDPFAHIKGDATNEKAAMLANFRKILEDFDADGDGRLSRDEAPLMLKGMFDRYDSDGDGFISMEDAQAWF